jgi:homocysteine S-methyltransferase
MSTNTTQLLAQRPFLTCAGTETWLYFEQKFPLREFCAFEVFDHEDALTELEENYLFPLMSAVSATGQGLLVDALTWRAHPDFVAALGFPPGDIKRINAVAVARTRDAVERWRNQTGTTAAEFPVLIAADIGPRGDGYKVEGDTISVEAAQRYHQVQIESLADTDIDLVCAYTMTSANESIGLAKAAKQLQCPIIISPTVETDGRLPDGKTLGSFVSRLDDATAGLPLFYMVNCAHPTHLAPALDRARDAGEGWLERFRGFRANCSRKSHAELDNSTELDRGNPRELAAELAAMRDAHRLTLLGGCCGTDVEHIAAIAEATA